MQFIVMLEHKSDNYRQFIRDYPSCSITSNAKNAVVMNRVEAKEAWIRTKKFNPAFNVTLEIPEVI